MWTAMQERSTEQDIQRPGPRSLVGLLLGLVLVSGCDDGAVAPSTTPTVTTVRLRDQPNRVSIATRGGHWIVTATLADTAGATYTPEGPVTYVARNTTMATVDAAGRVTGGAQSGVTFVVATTSFRGATLSDSVQVHVIAPDGR